VEGLKRLYRGLGLGFPDEARRLFGGAGSGGDASMGGGGDPKTRAQAGGGRWCLSELGRTVRCLEATELSDRELFYLPGSWEVIRVVARSLSARATRRGDLVTVFGDMYCRPHGTWENVRIPFHHVWTLCRGRALQLENALDATALTREGATVNCGA